MNISEKDLFNYVFFPDSLSKQKCKQIVENKHKFSFEISFLAEYKENLKEKVSDKIIEKILSKLEAFNNRVGIVLEKTNNPRLFHSEQLVLAAESPILEQKLRTDTFEDITDKQQNRIFIFNKDNSEMKNVKINIEPSGKSFVLESSFKPFIISPKQEINRISIYPND